MTDKVSNDYMTTPFTLQKQVIHCRTTLCSTHIYWCPCDVCRVLNQKHLCINTPKFQHTFYDADVKCKMPLTYNMLSQFVLMQLNQETFFYLTKNKVFPGYFPKIRLRLDMLKWCT